MNDTDARSRFAGLMETAARDREPVLIARNGVRSVVVLAKEEYDAKETTWHLLSTRANARHIEASLADDEAGRMEEHPPGD